MNNRRAPSIHRFGDQPAVPTFNADRPYPASLRALVRACLAELPGNRPTIQWLWGQIHLEVGSYVGLGGPPMKDLPRGDREVLQFKPETNLLWVPPP